MPKQFDFILAMAVIHNFPENYLIKLLNKIIDKKTGENKNHSSFNF